MQICNYCNRVLKHEYEKCPGCGGSSFSNKAYLGEEIIKKPPKDGYKINTDNYYKSIKNCNIIAGIGLLFVVIFILFSSPFLLVGLFEPTLLLPELIPIAIGIAILVARSKYKKKMKKEIERAEKLSTKGILVKNIPYKAVETGTMVNGYYYKCLQVNFKNSQGVEIPLYSETKFDIEKNMEKDKTADLLIDPDDYSNYFIDFEIF